MAANLKTEPGRKYADSAGAAALAPLAAAVRTCSDSLSRAGGKPSEAADTVTLDVYLMLNRRGGVKALVARPAGGVADCLARGAPAIPALPSPPSGNYWIRVRLPGGARPWGTLPLPGGGEARGAE